MKRALALLLTFALFVTLAPVYGVPNQASAAGSYFLFPNENASRENARIVSTQNIQLTGTINGVVGSSISYNVKQVTPNGTETVLNTTEEITTGIMSAGDNSLTVSSVILFPGMNKITFRGVAGSSTVSESIYIEYRDSPMLYDLKVQFENQSYDLLEDQPTMLYSSATTTQTSGSIVITGRAPNATKVNITINGRSFDFNVPSSAANTFRFSTSQLTIDQGINNVTFKVHNGGQIVETTRQIAYYNGAVTYYDLKVNDGTNSTPFDNNLDLPVSSASNLTISGKAIVPLPIYSNGAPIELRDANGDLRPAADVEADVLAALNDGLKLEIQGEPSAIAPVANSVNFIPKPIESTTRFITVDFTYDLPQLQFDARKLVRFIAPNLDRTNQSSWMAFTLRDSNLAYIHGINYLTGFDSSMTNGGVSRSDTRILNLTGTNTQPSGVDVYSIPMGVEILIANADNLALSSTMIQAAVGGSSALDYNVITRTDGSVLSDTVQRIINGERVDLRRVFVEINRLPKSGTNNILFNLNGGGSSSAVVSVIARLLYGPYVKFDSIVDGMDVRYDTVSGDATALLEQLGNFEGRIFNVTNTNEIVYKSMATATEKQSVFLYINNVEVPLAQGAAITEFQLEDLIRDTEMISNILNKAGENTLKFMFLSPNNNYQNTIKFNIVPTNLPMIPAENTDGVYPHTRNQWPPVSNDPKFTGQNGVFTTREASYNVFGTFDFLDLGRTTNNFDTEYARIVNKNEYIVTISNPDWDTPVKWDLGKEMTILNGDRSFAPNPNGTLDPWVVGSGSPVTPDANITFYYDLDKQSFMFGIDSQNMPEDGSTMVYVITVFNAGENGPRATYRLEVRPISIPYTIQSPLPEERITNSNFVEVIISSPGADSIMVGKEMAEKIIFREYNGSADVEGTPIEAFRAVVKNLKASRDTKIPFVITRGEDSIKQEITVKYVPTNIPGAQMLATMNNNHKMFNNALTLTFTKGTQLIRPGYNDSVNHATQVYNNNEILFAIANPNDGIIDRHMFKGQPANYSANSQAEGNLHIGYRFQDQARQYIKASPLFWIDGGLADDPSTEGIFDPITTGIDPFPFDNYDGKYTKSFTNRWNEFGLELMPSNPGKLTLTYDSNIVDSAGTTITVFRFDPFNSTWENIGGVVDAKKKTITVPFTKFGYYVAAKLTRGFNDVTDHPYAREAMEAMYSKGVMNAIDPSGLFGGDRYVTRGEFTRMIVRALELDLNYSGDLHFSYYPETVANANNSSAIYDYRYIETAARAGIVNGKRPGFFDEDVELTRQEAATILARALKLKQETDSAKAKSQLDKVFKDSGTFDFYSIPPVLAIQKKGFIQGKLVNPLDPKEGYVFEPRARLLRSDAAIIMARVMNDMKKLPKIYN